MGRVACFNYDRVASLLVYLTITIELLATLFLDIDEVIPSELLNYRSLSPDS